MNGTRSLQGPGRFNDPDPIARVYERIKRLEQQLSDATSQVLRAAGVRARPGKIASFDWDGTDHDHLGTTGWVLGHDDDGPSYLGLNGADLFEFLLGQTVENERDPGTTLNYSSATDGDTGVIWWPADAGDASVSITTSSTGRLRVDVSGSVDAQASGYGEGSAFIGYEILAGSTQVVAPLERHGAYVIAHGGGFHGITSGPGDGSWTSLYGSGFDLITVDPATTYTVRTRRGYRTRAVGAAPAGCWNVAQVVASTTRIAVTKLGL